MNLKTSLQNLVSRLSRAVVPTSRRTIADSRSEPPNLARGVTVEFIHGVIASAEGGQTRDLFALYRDMILTDSHLQSEITKRKLAVLGDAMQFVPPDKTLEADTVTAAAVQSTITSLPGWLRTCSFLLDASLYPVSVIEKVYKGSGSGYVIDALIPVPYQLLDFTDGHLMIFDSDPQNGQTRSEKHVADPNRYIVHRGHLLSSPDNWGGPMRSVLFWWLLSTVDREWWAKFLDRYGSPFLLGKFHDEEGRTILERAFSLATRLGGLAVSESTNVEIKQAAASDSGQAFEAFHTLCQREKSKLVLGQTLSAESQPTGIGSGASVIQENVRQDIRKFDARMLAETIRDQLILQFCQINRLPGRPPSLSWGSETTEGVASTTGLLKSLYDAGLQVSEESLPALSERVGLKIERRSQSAPGAAVPFSSDVVQRLMTLSAEDPRAYRGAIARVSQIVRESTSSADCARRLRALQQLQDRGV